MARIEWTEVVPSPDAVKADIQRIVFSGIWSICYCDSRGDWWATTAATVWRDKSEDVGPLKTLDIAKAKALQVGQVRR